MERGENEPAEVLCPFCKVTAIIYLPVEDLPKCPECGRRMVIRELLDEGKAF
jgi:hypothetical protein